MTELLLEQRCRRTLDASWTTGERDGVAFSYTRPSPERYRWQWYWDSCFAAIAWRHLDPARSRAELETLLAAARPDGFIGHTIFWFSLSEHFAGLRRYWRGPTWVNRAWLIWRGLVRLGYLEHAATIARAITETVSREGLHEFYDPHDGRGMGAEDFAWSALALDLLDLRGAGAGTPQDS
jgi:hypothetical protein